MAKHNPSVDGPVPLSERENDILACAAEGMADKEIAAKYGISFSTVRSYWDRIKEKLGAANRAHAIALSMPHNRMERISEELAGFIVRSIPDEAIFACDEKGKLLTWNEGVRQVFGFSEKEWISRSASIFFPDDEKSAAARELADASEAGLSVNDRWHQRKDGTRFWGTNIVIPVIPPHGHAAFVKIVRPKPGP